MIKVFKTIAESETFRLGFKIGELLNKNNVLTLDGDLGTGKTAITKGIAKALGVNEHITSPTFTIVNEYKGRHLFFHFDVYRVHDIDELLLIGFEDYLTRDGIVVIEWGNLIKDLIPKDSIRITINKDLSLTDKYRKITVDFNNEIFSAINDIQI